MKQSVFTLKENIPLCAEVSRLFFSGDSSAIERPGQFVDLSLPGLFLRRPFSVCDWDESGFSLLCEEVGKGTALMRALPAGTQLDILTGLGNGFDLAPAGADPLLVGGGSGVSPLLGLARRLLERGVRPHVILGFNRDDEIMLLDDFHRLGISPTVTTADGSFGIRGFVTEAMQLPHSYFYTCGPVPMMRAVCQASPADGQLSFDRRMGCGFGACMGCTVNTADGPKRICRDGPVLRKEDVLWED